jgi:hypothetical protein
MAGVAITDGNQWQEVKPGAFVVMEKLTKDKTGLEYASGEYVVIRVTPHAIYAAKPKVGYDFSNESSFLIAGNDPWTVAAYRFDREAAISIARENVAWGDAGGKSWVEGVYKNAAANGRAILRALGVTESVKAFNFVNTVAVPPVPYTLSPALEAIANKFGCESGHVKEFARQLLAEIKGVN